MCGTPKILEDLTGKTDREEAEKAARRQAAALEREQQAALDEINSVETKKRARQSAGIEGRTLGRAATLLTGGQGVVGSAGVSSKKMLLPG